MIPLDKTINPKTFYCSIIFSILFIYFLKVNSSKHINTIAYTSN